MVCSCVIHLPELCKCQHLLHHSQLKFVNRNTFFHKHEFTAVSKMTYPVLIARTINNNEYVITVLTFFVD